MRRLLFLLVGFVSFAIHRERSAFDEKYWTWDNGDAEERVYINTSDLYFPKGFVWGTATAAHQVEGNSDNNNWALFERIPGKIKGNHTAGIACDHWNRVEEDTALMGELGVNAYRFSVEWSKVEPSKGAVDRSVLDHYHREIDLLLSRGITPWITLFHFTLPVWFVELGEFEKHENIAHFVEFSRLIFTEYGHKVKYWNTVNEPSVFVTFGWMLGTFPPGKLDWHLAGEVLRNVLDAHVEVYHALKALPHGREAQIGIVHNVAQFEAWRAWNPLDVAMANIMDMVFNEAVLLYLRTGKFHFRALHILVSHDNPRAPASNDFIGLNYYSHYHVQFQASLDQPFRLLHAPNSLMTDFFYPIYPEGIYRAIKRVEQLRKPIYITENGLADRFDDRRELFLRRYLYAVSRAIKEGSDVRGYFYWSLMDNFEWAEGYHMRFGLYEVDFATQKRTLRHSANYLKKVILTATDATP